MTDIYIDTKQQVSTTGTDAQDLGASDTLFLAATGSLIALGGGVNGVGFSPAALNVAGNNVSVVTEGALYSAHGDGFDVLGTGLIANIDGSVNGTTGVYIGGETPTTIVDDTVTIGSGGTVTGRTAGFVVEDLNGSATANIINNGTISGGQFGFDLRINSSLDSVNLDLENTGVVTAHDLAFEIEDATDVNITNSGKIVGAFQAAGATTVEIDNSGSWHAHGVLFMPDGSSNFVNTGLIVAAGINFGAGDDFIDNLGVVRASIFMGSGTLDIMQNEGTIEGEIQFAGTGRLENFGTIVGNVFFTQGRNFVDDTSGTILGQLIGGRDADSFYGGDSREFMFGGKGNDSLIGGGGNDSLSGGNGADFISGDAGDDNLTGGKKSDQFLFQSCFGHDIINDFHAGEVKHDTIAFTTDVFADFAAVQSHMAQAGTSVVITLDGGDTIDMFGVTLASLTAADFTFV